MSDRQKRMNEHMDAFLESGRRCEICDAFGKNNIPIKHFPFVCEDCKKKKETKLYLEKKRIEGLIAHYVVESGNSWKTFESNFAQLSFQRGALIVIEKELEQSKLQAGEK